MARITLSLKVLCLLLAMLVIPAAVSFSPAFAAPAATQTFNDCPDVGVTYRVVSCFDIILTQAMTDMFLAIKPMVDKISGAAAMLAVMFFGMRMSVGGVNFASNGVNVPQGVGEAVMLTMKIGLMLFFIADFDEYYPLSFQASTGLIEIVTSPLDSTMIDMGCTQKLMETEAGKLDPSAPDYRLRVTWARVDCLVGSMLGYGIMSGGTFLGLAPVLEGALTSSLSDKMTGSIGPLIVYMGYTMMFGVLMATYRTLYVYVYSMIAIAFLWMLAPFAGMCLLFRSTTEYFTKWVTYLLSLILQPVLMLCFLTIMIVALDRAIYTSPYSLLSVLTGKIACDPTSGACDYNVWKEALTEMQETGKLGKCDVTKVSVNRETMKMNDCSSQMQNRVNAAGSQEVPNEAQWVYNMQDPKCSANMPTSAISTFSPGFDGFTNFTVDSVCLNGVDPMELFASLAVVTVICYLLYQMMEIIPEFAYRISGGLAITGAASQSLPLQDQISIGAQSSAQTYIQTKDPAKAMESFVRDGGGRLPWIGGAVSQQFEQPKPTQPQQPSTPRPGLNTDRFKQKNK